MKLFTENYRLSTCI